jgi:hypothetical protein
VGWVRCRGGGGGGTKELWGFEIREGGGGGVGIVLMKRVIRSFCWERQSGFCYFAFCCFTLRCLEDWERVFEYGIIFFFQISIIISKLNHKKLIILFVSDKKLKNKIKTILSKVLANESISY